LNYSDGVRPEGSLLEAQDKNFYGLTYSGGQNNCGTIFRISPSGAHTVLYNFKSQYDGKNPKGTLIVSKTNGYLYGVCSKGGDGGYGTVFRISIAGVYSTVYSFPEISGGPIYHYTSAALVEDELGRLFGLGRVVDYGFSGTTYYYWLSYIIDLKNNNSYSEKLTPSSNEATVPQGGLVKASDGYIYCMKWGDGAKGAGCILQKDVAYSPFPHRFTIVASFDFAVTGGNPMGDLCDGGDGFLYGATSVGGNFGQGTIFKYSLSTHQITVIRHIKSLTDGGKTAGGFYKNSDGYFYGMASEGGGQASAPNITTGFGAIFKINSTGSAFSIVTKLPDATLGMVPRNSLALANDGNYYGTTEEGGYYGAGTFFKLTPAGVFSRMYSFYSTSTGGNPKDGVIQASDGNFYGTTYSGGSYGYGTVYKMSPTGTLTVLHHFNGTLGASPRGRLLQASDGMLYGTTRSGGTNNVGTIFKITLGGVFSVIRHFVSGSDGAFPEGSLYQADPGGPIWGTATEGGVNNNGTVFKFSGTTFSVVRNLGTADGRLPSGNLMKGSNGILYGTTNAGGANGYGTVFRITGSTGYFRVVYNFQGGTAGAKPYCGLVEGPNQILYGTASAGGSYGGGVVFSLTLDGLTYTVLKHFDATGISGTVPKGNLIYRKATTASRTALTNDLISGDELATTAKMIYPNPATDHIVIQTGEVLNSYTVQVINSQGQVVRGLNSGRRVTESAIEVNVSSLASGNYFVIISTVKGQTAFKFVKQ
jgi:uncharacterized repeat protein (TIGR03803 family)